jgi:nucleotide-binding universal stress UspA family protein
MSETERLAVAEAAPLDAAVRRQEKGVMVVTALLVPLDGSALAERALPYAAALAARSGARIVLARVAPPASGGAEAEARDYLSSVAARLAELGLTVEPVVATGEVAEAVAETARAQSVDLLVMATHGRGGLGRWVYGSVAEALMARLPLPILLVRAWLPASAEPLRAERPRLLAALDGSALAEQALPVAERLADALSGELVLLRVVTRPDAPFAPDWVAGPAPAYDFERAKAEAEAYLQQLAEQLERSGRRVRIDARVGEPGLTSEADAIEAAGREHGAALVVMTTHGYTGLQRLVLGSVTDAVLRRSTLPVIVLRPQPSPDAAPEC